MRHIVRYRAQICPVGHKALRSPRGSQLAGMLWEYMRISECQRLASVKDVSGIARSMRLHVGGSRMKVLM